MRVVARRTHKNGLFLMFLLFWVAPLWASEYVVVLVSGESYQCRAKYALDVNGMVRFRLASGPEMAVPQNKVAWYETAIANGEEPPPGSKPIKKQKVEDTKTTKTPFPEIEFSLPDTSSVKTDLKSLLHDGFKWDAVIQFGVLTWLVVVLFLIFGYFVASFLLWYIMNILGEPHVFFKVLGVNALLFLSAGIIWFLSGYSFLDPIHTVLIAASLNLFVSAVLIIMIFECELTAGVMSILLYQIVLTLFGYGIWKALGFWIG